MDCKKNLPFCSEYVILTIPFLNFTVVLSPRCQHETRISRSDKNNNDIEHQTITTQYSDHVIARFCREIEHCSIRLQNLAPEKFGTRLHDRRARNRRQFSGAGWCQFSGAGFWSVCHWHKGRTAAHSLWKRHSSNFWNLPWKTFTYDRPIWRHLESGRSYHGFVCIRMHAWLIVTLIVFTYAVLKA